MSPPIRLEDAAGPRTPEKFNLAITQRSIDHTSPGRFDVIQRRTDFTRVIAGAKVQKGIKWADVATSVGKARSRRKLHAPDK